MEEPAVYRRLTHVLIRDDLSLEDVMVIQQTIRCYTWKLGSKTTPESPVAFSDFFSPREAPSPEKRLPEFDEDHLLVGTITGEQPSTKLLIGKTQGWAGSELIYRAPHLVPIRHGLVDIAVDRSRIHLVVMDGPAPEKADGALILLDVPYSLLPHNLSFSGKNDSGWVYLKTLSILELGERVVFWATGNITIYLNGESALVIENGYATLPVR